MQEPRLPGAPQCFRPRLTYPASLIPVPSAIMSNSSSINALSGGLPTVHDDMAPSVIFLIAYILSTALCLYRMLVQYRSPGRLLFAYFRLQLFEVARVVTFIMRILLAENFTKVQKEEATLNKGILIGEQVLLGIGFLIPAFVLVRLVGYHTGRKQGGTIGVGRKRSLTWMMEMALTVALIFGVVAGVNFNNALNNADSAKSVKTDRTVSSVVVLVVLILLVLYSLSLLGHSDLPWATSLWLGLTSLLLIVVPSYCLHNIAHIPKDVNSSTSKAEFYVLQLAVEWIVGASLLAVNAKEWCGIDERLQYSPEMQAMKSYSAESV
ncbi:hypothetical protein EW146_g6683 [Bondarzewia mesenterica]|uniref:Uncharacterized protein n=1 Tax=Bondarzewia mesenterica TaxID=1095465 RepID=A0A4S4LMT7_9AGAM|nr:hypothetical protein EW146_g6683 [Bondarzewia mesenterica]